MRKKFKPAVTARNAMVEDPSQSKKVQSAAVKRKVQEEDDKERLSQLRNLEKQGQIMSMDGDEVEALANTIQSLPSKLMRFTLNAAIDTLPHNANLHLWGKNETDACPLCGERQTLDQAQNREEQTQESKEAWPRSSTNQ